MPGLGFWKKELGKQWSKKPNMLMGGDKIQPNSEQINFSDMILSILVASIIGMLLSHNLTFSLTESAINDGSIMQDSRLSGITTDSLKIISDHIDEPIIAIGSSMTLKALDGKCVTENLTSPSIVHNLAHVNSMPWNDMIHIPRIIELNPTLVLIEIGPNIMTNLTSEKALEYSELRYKTDTAKQENLDFGGWYDLLDPRLKTSVATNDITRMEFRQEYVVDSIEEKLNLLIYNESKARKEWTYGWVPQPGNSNDWLNYLQTPPFPSDRNGFDGMETDEREEYNLTKMKLGANYNPQINSYGQRILEYEINTLVNNGIEVLLVVLPQHPDSLTFVPNGKWDELNQSINNFAESESVFVFDQLWESGWFDQHFFDRNHLDDEGRFEFCNRLAPVINDVISGRD
jgi:hypothetical protein